MHKTKSSIDQYNTKSQTNLIKASSLGVPHYLQVLNKPQTTLNEIISPHNPVYLSIIYMYICQICFQNQQKMNKLKSIIQTIQMADLMVVDKQTLPKYLQQIYEFKSLKSSLFSCLDRFEKITNNKLQVKKEIQKMLLEHLNLLGFILLFRYMTIKRYNASVQQIWLLGNQLKYIKDFREDARGNIIKLLSIELEIQIKIYVCNKLTTTTRFLKYLPQNSLKTFHIVLEENKTYLINNKSISPQQDNLSKQNNKSDEKILKTHKEQLLKKYSLESNTKKEQKPFVEPNIQYKQVIKSRQLKINSQIRVSSVNKNNISISSCTENFLSLQSDLSTVSTSEIKNKNCPKCGRIKTQKFCICRKSREDSAPKAGSKFQPGIVTANCKKCFLSRPLPGQNYCRQCKTRLGK